MYKFTNSNGWETIDDFLTSEGSKDFQDELKKSNYQTKACIKIGSGEFGDYAIEVFGKDPFNSSEVKYEYLACLDIGGLGNLVAVPTMPDLVELLAKIGPVAASAGLWTIESEKYQSEIDEKYSKTK